MLISVQIVRRKNGLALVQWENERRVPQRAWVTVEMVREESGSSALVESPERGVPLGIPWSRILSLSATPEAVERELRRRGIWTYADLQVKPQDAIGALQAVYGVDFAALMTAAKEASDG